jgi:hypothetical protein
MKAMLLNSYGDSCDFVLQGIPTSLTDLRKCLSEWPHPASILWITKESVLVTSLCSAATLPAVLGMACLV